MGGDQQTVVLFFWLPKVLCVKTPLKELSCHPAQTVRAADVNLSDTGRHIIRTQHCSRATIPLAYSSSCCLKGQTGHRKARMSSLVLFPITNTLITLHWKEMEDKLSLSNKQVLFSIAKMSGKIPGNWISIDFPVSILLFLVKNWIITIFLEINHPPGDYSFFEERHLSLFESIGLTIAPGPLALFGQHAQSYPLENTKDHGPPSNSPPWGPLLLIAATRSACRPS